MAARLRGRQRCGEEAQNVDVKSILDLNDSLPITSIAMNAHPPGSKEEARPHLHDVVEHEVPQHAAQDRAQRALAAQLHDLGARVTRRVTWWVTCESR